LITRALIALFPESPEKVVAEGAEGGLTEELGHEAMTFYQVDFLMLHRSASCSDPNAALHKRLGLIVSPCEFKLGKIIILIF